MQKDSYSEVYNITGFPSQDQAIYGGWISSNSSTGSLTYYNLYSKDNTDINSTSANTEVPLIIYLAGGPGVPSTFAAFTEIGPYLIKSNGDSSFTNVELQKNPHSLTQNYHLLVIDQPVGTGFSICKENDFVASAGQAADYLITFFLRFYELYPSLQKIPTYFYGHSYGGKYVSNLVYKWLQHSKLSKINPFPWQFFFHSNKVFFDSH